MNTYTIEFIFDADKHRNGFLRLLNQERIDIEITYYVSDRQAMITKVVGADGNDTFSITAMCEAMGCMDELRQACELHYAGLIAKELFSTKQLDPVFESLANILKP